MGKYYLGTGNQQINFQVVDSTGVINDLNLSGLYLSITGKATDADKLDNYDSSFFRNAANLTGTYTGSVSGKAADSELLDGLDSSYFLNGANITGTVALSGTFTGYYTGAFSGTITHTDSITFHSGLGINPDPAELSWEDGVGTMNLGLKGGNVDLRVGLQNYEYVTNRTASTISKGSVIYVSGAQGNRPSISLALGAADTTSANTFGLAAEDIASMADGYAITNGLLTNLNTTGFAEGAALYLSPTVSGAITSTKPQAPQHSVLVGFCVRSHQSAGEILVKIQNGLEIDELHDVRILNKQNNDIIRYHAPSGVWYNSDTLAINGTGANYISGDLGIGIASPSAKLHIFGADKRQIITSTTDNAALVLGQWDGTTNRIESSTRKLLLTSYANGISLGINGSENVHVSTSGYLGIGTTSPLTTLNLSISGGNGPVYQTFTDTTNAYHHGYVGKNGGGLVFGFSSQNGSFSTDEKMRITTSGNVGIGTTSPGYKLDIQGGSIRVLDAAGPVINLSDNSTRNWDIGLNATTDAFYIRDVVAAVTRMTINTSGSTTFDGELTLIGSKLAFTDDGTNINATVTSRRLQLVATGSSVVTGYNTDFYFSNETSVAKYNGNVGIGITNPTNKLEIATGNSATTGIRVRDSANGVWTDIYRATIKFFGGGGVIDTNDTTDAIDIRQAGNSRLFIAQSNSTYNGVSVGGWVGIGTSAPSQRLEVLGDLDMAGLKVTTTTGRGRITVASQTISYSSYLELNSGESQIAFLDGNYNSNRLRIATNRTGAYIAFETDAQSEKMRITSSGNVGIGTTSPTSKLYVSGDIAANVDNSLGVKLNRSATNVWNGIGYSTANSTKWFVGLRESGDDNLRWYNYTNTSEKMVLTEAGSLGIGTTTPTYKLHVVGDARIGTNGQRVYLFDDGNAHIHSGSGPLWLNAEDASGIYINNQNNGSVYLTNGTGRVGIGTTSVSYNLEVAKASAGATFAVNADMSAAGEASIIAFTSKQYNTYYKAAIIAYDPHGGSWNRRGLAFCVNNTTDGTSATYASDKALYIAPDKSSTFYGNVTIGGDLIINGTTTTVNSTVTTIDDPIITLGGDTAPTTDDNKDRGVEFRWHNGTAAKVGFFGFDDSTGYFTFIPDATNSSEVFSGTQGDIQAVNFRGTLIGSLSNALTAGSYLTGSPSSSYNGSVAVTFAVDATSANTASKVVARDASGNFSAGTITASSFTDGYNTFTLAQINRSGGAVELQYNKSVAGENVHIFGNTANRWVWQADTGKLVLGTNGDTNLYRSAADTLKTDDNFVTAGNIGIGTTPSYKLDVAGAGSDQIGVRLTPDYGRVRFNGYDLLGYAGSNIWAISNGSYNQFTLGTSWNWDTSCDFTYTPGTVGAVGGSLIIGQTNKNSATFTHGYTALYTNGAEKVRINASGNVGIGTTTPNAKLEVYDSTNAVGGIKINNPNSGTGAHSSLSFANSNSSNGAGVVLFGGSWTTSNLYRQDGMYIYTNRNGGMTLAVETANPIYFATNNTERVRIDSSGNVGVGTTSPSVKLHVVGSSILANNTSIDPDAYGNTTIAGNIADGGGWGVGAAIGGNNGTGKSWAIGVSGDLYFGYQNGSANDTMQTFMQVGTNRNLFFVPVSGNVGVGTTTPTAAKLQISSGGISTQDSTRTFASTTFNSAIGSSDTRTLAFNGTGGSSVWWCDSGTPSFAIDSAGGTTGFWRYSSGWVQRMALDANGFGINTTSPGVKLTTRSGTNSLPATTGTAQAGAGLRVEGGDNAVIDIGANSVDTWIQATDKSALDNYYRLLLNPRGGNVGIGVTTNPAYKLEVNGSFAATGITVAKSSGISTITFPAGFNDPGYIQHEESTNNNGRMRFSVGDDNDDNDYFSFGNTSSGFVERLRISANGRLLLNYGMWHQSLDGYNRFNFTSNGRTYFGSGDGYEWRSAADSALMVLLNGGSVGIGTTSPGEKLHVSGTVRIDGTTDGLRIFKDGGASVTSTLYIANAANTRAYNWQLNASGNGLDFFTYDGSAWAYKITYLANGNVGIGTQAPAYKLEVNGSFAATTKSFVISHPTKEGKKLRYGSLEGPENGVYIRGKTTSKVIELPDYWTKLVDPESISVQLTPIGSHQKLYVEKIEDNKVYIANENLLAKNINCFFYILAERADVEKLQVEIDA